MRTIAEPSSPSRWHQQDSLASHLLAHPAPDGHQDLLEDVILAATHPSWLHALSRRPDLTPATWDILWGRGDPDLRAGLSARRLTTSQFARATGPQTWGTPGDRNVPTTLGSADSGRLAGSAVLHNPHLLDAPQIARLTTIGGEHGNSLRAAITAVALDGRLAVHPDIVTPVAEAAAAAGPLERARLSAAWAPLCPLDDLLETVEQAAELCAAASPFNVATPVITTLTHVTLARRPDLAGRVRTLIGGGRHPATHATWLAARLAEADETRLLMSHPPTDPAEALQMAHGHLLTLTVEQRLPQPATLYACRRLHPPATALRYGHLLTGANRCTRPDCWSRRPTAPNPTIATVGALRKHLAAHEHALVAGTTAPGEPAQGGPGPHEAPNTLEHPAITTLLAEAARHIGRNVARWELLLWLIDTVDADTPLADLVGLTDSL